MAPERGNRVTSTRLPCLVPFCRRTRGPRKGDLEPIEPDMDWICGPHWRLVSPKTKARYATTKRLLRKAVRVQRAVAAAQDKAWSVWEACKSEAIERTMGI